MFAVYVHGAWRGRDVPSNVHIVTDPLLADAVVCEDGALGGVSFAHKSLDAAATALMWNYAENLNKRENVLQKLTLASAVDRDRERKLLAYAERHHIVLRQPGCVILAPPCSGKTTYAKKSKIFCDLDDVMGEFGLHREGFAGRKHSAEQERRHYVRIDTWLGSMKKLGFSVLGSLYEAYVPDGIVILDERLHREYVEKRDDVTWGFAKSVRSHLERLARRNGVPIYKTIEAAVRG